jgi:ABC-type antimicrobial peptide transport system permease subunit
VARLVLRGLAPPLLLGLFFGATGTMAWDRAFSSGVRDLYAAGGTNLITITALLIGVVAVACFIPLRRAIRVDPVAALRHD